MRSHIDLLDRVRLRGHTISVLGEREELVVVSPVAGSGWIVDPCASARRGMLVARLLFG